EPVFIVEGEKDANRLAKLGLVATTNSGGAGNWHTLDPASVAKALKGHEVFILPDNDEAGRKHANQGMRSLCEQGVSAKVVELPGLPDKGDVSDWSAIPGNDRDALLRLCRQTAKPGRAQKRARLPEPYKPFPIETLPEPLRAYVQEAAMALGCDPA